MPFHISVLAQERRIEVVYPAQPTPLDVASYTLQLQQAIDGMRGTWCILVDQREVRHVPPELHRAMAGLAAYAQAKGMRRGARLVADAIAGLQTWRMHREAGLNIPVETFDTREAALTWLYAAPF